MNPVNWFELAATDMPRARSFYENVFGYTLSPMDMGPVKMAMFPGEQGKAGAPGALVMADGRVPSHDGTRVYFPVGDIEGTLAKVTASGGKILEPKSSIGEFGFIGLFEDTEGNRVGLHSMS